jgi:hypothetical protein
MMHCYKCAILVGALLAGCSHAYRGNPDGITSAEVDRARQSLCLAASDSRLNSADELVAAAIEKYGKRDGHTERVMGMALADYQSGQWTGPPKIADLMHEHLKPGEPEGS